MDKGLYTMDLYKNFQELAKNEQGNFEIECIDRGSNITIIAPHGGKIESYTTEIAKKIANNTFNYYSFIGRKNENNFKDLHITSTNFNEPKALNLVKKSEVVIAIHGCKDIKNYQDYGKHIFIGGRNKKLKDTLEKLLIANNFSVNRDKFPGKEPNNICNQGTTKAGIQFELTYSFREDSNLRNKFINIIKNYLLKNL